MSDGVFISDRPQLAIARQTVSFASLGLNDPTLCRIIYEVGNPYLSYVPTDEFNPISGITEGKSYLLYLNSFFDGSPALANAVLTNLIPQTETNVFAGERVVFLCTSSVSFATAGITTSNTNLITLVSEGYFTSYDPNDSINGIDGFVEGELYDIDPITDIDLHLYGVTKIRYSDEVLYLDSLEDVVITNSNPDATLPLDQEEILVRNPTTGVWENQTYDPGIPASDIPDGLISGGKVIWVSGLTFKVTAAVYYIDGVRYESAEGNITLDAADPSNPRFDLIVLNDSSAIDKITGTPASDPSEPQIDPATQLYLTSVLVGAGATVPTGVTDVIIYDENTEWAHSTSGTISVNFANTTNTSNGTKSAAVASWSAGAAIIFTNTSPLSTGDVKNFSLKVKLTVALTKNQNISLQFFNGATATSLQMPVAISKTIVSSYQTFALTNIDFTGALFDRVKLLFAGSNTSVLYIDEVRYQSGVNQPGGGGTFTETDPTVPVLVKQIPVSTDATTTKYLNWDGSKYIRKQVAYSEVSGTPTIPSAYTDEQAQDAVGTILSSEFTYDDATPQISINQIAYSKLTGTPTIPTQYTDEMAQDATAALFAAGTHTGITFTYDDAGNKISAVVTGSGVNALAAIGSTPNANGATISGSTLNLQPANSSFGGVVTTLTQTFAGVKTFQGSASSGSRQLSGITTGTGNGVFGQSQNGGYGGEFNTLHSSTNTMRAAVKVVRETSGTAAVGIGSAVSYHAESSDNNIYGLGMSGRVIYGLLGTSIQSAIRHTVYNGSTEVIAEETFAATVNTSDATPTNLITIPVTDETAAVVEVTIVGKEVSTNGIVVGKKIFRYKKDGGTLSLGTQTSVLADEATGTIATATYAISSTSNNLSVDVTGVAAVTITWKVNVKIISN